MPGMLAGPALSARRRRNNAKFPLHAGAFMQAAESFEAASLLLINCEAVLKSPCFKCSSLAVAVGGQGGLFAALAGWAAEDLRDQWPLSTGTVEARGRCNLSLLHAVEL